MEFRQEARPSSSGPHPARPSADASAPLCLTTLGESGSPHTSAVTSPLTPCACGQGIPSLAILENPGVSRAPGSPPNHPSQLGRHQRGERTVAKGKVDPTLSRRRSFLCSHLQPWPAGELEVTGPGKATAGGSWAGVSVFKAAMARDTASANTDRAKAIIYTSLYLYIRYRHRWAGAPGSLHPHLHFCSTTHRSSRS